MVNLHSFSVLQTFNVLTYLGFTAANIYAFVFTYIWRAYVGKDTYLSAAPWIDIPIILIHILFIGTLAYVQWTERGRDIVVGGLSYRWPAVMFFSIFWTETWLRGWLYTSWVFAAIVAVLAVELNRTIKRRYRLQYEVDLKEELLIHVPFSIFEGWAILILASNTFATFAPVSQASNLATRVFAVWLLILITGVAFLSSFSYTTGDIPLALTLAFGQFAIFSRQITHENNNYQHLVAWFALAFAIMSVWALAYSAWKTSYIIRHGAGSVRLEEPAEEHA